MATHDIIRKSICVQVLQIQIFCRSLGMQGFIQDFELGGKQDGGRMIVVGV